MSGDVYDTWVSSAFKVHPDKPSAGATAGVSMDLSHARDYKAKHVTTGKANGSVQPALPANAQVLDFSEEDTADLDLNTVSMTAKVIGVAAQGNATAVGVSILNACQKFHSYAEPKLNDVHDGASSLFKIILETALSTVLGAKLLEKAAEAVGKEISGAVKSYVKGKIVDGVLSGLKEDSSNKELKKALDSLTAAATDSGGAISNIVNQHLKPVLDGIVTKAASGPLNTAERHFILKFVNAGPSQMDEMLEELGIPSPANAKSLELAVYKKMVHGLELSVSKAEIRDEMGKFEFADMAKNDPIQLKFKIRHRADDRAETAMAIRADEMRKNGR